MIRIGHVFFGFMMIISAYNVQAHTHVEKMIEEHPSIVIEFMRDGCSYCQYLTPLFNQTAALCAHKPVTFVIININTLDKSTKDHFQLKTYPTVIYFKQGKEQARHGSNDKKMTVQQMLDNIESIYHS